MDYYTMDDFDFSGKRVLVRTNFDVPVDDNGNITDDRRIMLSVPTIRYLLEKNASKIIIMFHMGRPKGRVPELSTTKVASRLAEMMGIDVAKVDSWGENGLPEARVIMLENVRFNAFEKSKDEAERDSFGKQLAGLADIFVMDAFSNMHHAEQASMTGAMKYLPSCLGIGSKKEIDMISRAIENPERPFVSIIGGLKAEKLNAVHNLLKKVDRILVAGALAFTVQKAMGYEMGDSKIDSEGLTHVQEIVTELKDNPKVILPSDAVIADRFDELAESEVVAIDSVRPGWMALDIGPATVGSFRSELLCAKTIIWNGPIGVFEFEKFSKGTREIAATLAEAVSCGACVIVGGGDSADVIDKLKLEDKVTFVSSGGGASLLMFEGKTLPTMDHLVRNKQAFAR
ncbi:phosphoglycerate kinase [Candidatus Woesearchaeota archaeon]|nr:phosphoglycerate kinase [Candidatus Woesearchaeota archaeon]